LAGRASKSGLKEIILSPKSSAMMVDLKGTALMGTRHVMNHRSPNLCIVRCGGEDNPVKLMFLAVPSPATEYHTDSSGLLPEGWDARHATSIACLQEADSTSCDDAGTPPAVAEERCVWKPSRPCKGKRNRYQKLVKHLEAQILQDPSSFDFQTVTLPPSLQRNDTQRAKLRERMHSFQYQAKMRDEVEVNRATV